MRLKRIECGTRKLDPYAFENTPSFKACSKGEEERWTYTHTAPVREAARESHKAEYELETIVLCDRYLNVTSEGNWRPERNGKNWKERFGFGDWFQKTVLQKQPPQWENDARTSPIGLKAKEFQSVILLRLLSSIVVNDDTRGETYRVHPTDGKESLRWLCLNPDMGRDQSLAMFAIIVWLTRIDRYVDTTGEIVEEVPEVIGATFKGSDRGVEYLEDDPWIRNVREIPELSND